MVEAVLPGREGALVSLALLWLIALNVVVTPLLLARGGASSVALGFFDLAMDLAYGFAALAAAVVLAQQTSEGELPSPAISRCHLPPAWAIPRLPFAFPRPPCMTVSSVLDRP